MNKFGIIGKPLEHSYSAQYFNQKFAYEKIDADYQLYEIDDLTDIHALIQQLHGFNVTYPYKQMIMEHLQSIDPIAKEIGAVNVVCQGKGYNTDWIGFMRSIIPHLTPHDRHALVLGTGGVSKAVQYALHKMGITYTLVSRQRCNNTIAYEELTEAIMQSNTIIINCTPLGMLPDVDSLPAIPYQYLNPTHLLYDCVYNPACTAFLHQGAIRGARILNGLQMLYQQADAAWEIWQKQ
jgi:shikimate dehydrogenase